MAIAAVSGRSGNTSGYAGIALTKLVGTDTMYFDIYRGGTNSDYISNNKITATFIRKGTGSFSRNYDYAQSKGQKLTLRGGNDWFAGHDCTTSGTCDFG